MKYTYIIQKDTIKFRERGILSVEEVVPLARERGLHGKLDVQHMDVICKNETIIEELLALYFINEEGKIIGEIFNLSEENKK